MMIFEDAILRTFKKGDSSAMVDTTGRVWSKFDGMSVHRIDAATTRLALCLGADEVGHIDLILTPGQSLHWSVDGIVIVDSSPI